MHAGGLAASAGEMRRRQGVMGGAASHVPWIPDSVAPGGQQRFPAALPDPVRVISRLRWEPHYRQRGRWQP
jgi:hypothetical protein